MNREKQIPVQEEVETGAEERRKGIARYLPYDALVGNVRFMVFLCVLCVLYIANNKKAVDTQRALNWYTDTLKELRWEHMDAKKQVMYAQTETEIIKSATAIELHPMTVPAFTIQTDTIQKAQRVGR